MSNVFPVFAYSVYALREPNGALRYVGMTTTTLAERLGGHIRACRKDPESWITELLSCTEEPEIVLLERCSDLASLKERERWWIGHLWKEGHRLTNIDGAVGRQRGMRRNKPRHKPGARIGRLVVLEFLEDDPRTQHRYSCRCDCGLEVVRTSRYLSASLRPSCGCWEREIKRAARPGRGAPWNKGLTEETDPRVARNQDSVRATFAAKRVRRV